MRVIAAAAFCAAFLMAANALTEEERVNAWYASGDTWPPKWQPETEGMQRLMSFREDEIMRIPSSQERWENWMQYTQSRLVPKWTKRGFEVVDTPPSVHARLVEVVKKGVENWDELPEEGEVPVIYNTKNLLPKFVFLGDLTEQIHKELQTMHEQWGGMKLKPTSAYGVRLYQNGSSLAMHYDKMATHVISSIVHIAHEYDNDDEPWPIQIEDHDGNLHTVNLQPGQMLFYESAKCLHGRMKEFKGKYYGSIFVHYQPVDKNIWNYGDESATAHIPPHWMDGTIPDDEGSRWAGAALTVDSRVAEGANHRIINGEIVHRTEPQDWPPIQPPPEYVEEQQEGEEQQEEGDEQRAEDL